MSLSLNAHIICKPITHDHIVSILRSSPDSGFHDQAHVWKLIGENPRHTDEEFDAANLLDAPLRAQADEAEKRIHDNDTLTQAVLESSMFQGASMLLDMKHNALIQVMALCPCIFIAESRDVDLERKEFWALENKLGTLDLRAIEIIADTMALTTKDASVITQARALMLDNLGKQVLVLGH